VTTLVDTSLWIDFTRTRSPRVLKQFIAPYILSPTSHLAEPIIFEILRHATAKERGLLNQQLQTLPLLATPPSLWMQASELGQACRDKGCTVGAIDLLIAGVALANQALVVTFEEDFQKIAKVCELQVKLLRRPT
jgi:predicted nucleic acid-binding protein